MPRKYDKIIRFYSSWFADLTEPDKGWTPEERWKVILTIAQAQMMSDVSHLDSLPIEIKRGLQMATLKEQVYRMLERSEAMSSRGKKGADARKRAEDAELAKNRQEMAKEHQKQAEQRLEDNEREIEVAKATIRQCLAEGKEVPQELRSMARALGMMK